MFWIKKAKQIYEVHKPWCKKTANANMCRCWFAVIYIWADYTEITEVNLPAVVYRLFHEDCSSIDGTKLLSRLCSLQHWNKNLIPHVLNVCYHINGAHQRCYMQQNNIMYIRVRNYVQNTAGMCICISWAQYDNIVRNQIFISMLQRI